ncbi:MAG: hypothetical protein LUD47_07420 [Clostridia bacterium]|nr:hypothetical protein [Clostridia bacterium]
MTANTMIRNYRAYSAADRYIIGYLDNHNVYMVETDKIMPRFLHMEKASQKNGGGYSLRLRITKDRKQELKNQNPVCLGSEMILKSTLYNRGEMFEKAVTEYLGQTWTKDNKPFYKGGDIETKDHSYQVKFDGATVTTESVLKRARQELKSS